MLIHQVKTVGDVVKFLQQRNGLSFGRETVVKLTDYIDMAHDGDSESYGDIAQRLTHFIQCVERSSQLPLFEHMLNSWF